MYKVKNDDPTAKRFEPENVLYGQGFRGSAKGGRYNKTYLDNCRRGGSSYGGDSWRGNNQYNSGSNNWRQNRDTRPRCNICESVFHFAKECPDNPINKTKSGQQLQMQLFTKETELCFLEQFVSETLNCAIVDSGCAFNVCEKNWLKRFTDTLPTQVNLHEKPSTKSFKFGPSKTYESINQVNIPVNFGGIQAYILTDAVDCEIPLLLSKDSLKKANSYLDFVNDVLVMNGTKIKLQHTSNGHYCIPLTPKKIVIDTKDTHGENNHCPVTVYLSIDNIDSQNTSEKRTIARKLHLQFGHPVDSNRLKSMCRVAGIEDKGLLEAIDDITDSCDTCNRYRKAKSRPVVSSLPMASDFNEMLAMDLKFVTVDNHTYTILHMIDVFKRYSSATIIKSKHKETIVGAIPY